MLYEYPVNFNVLTKNYETWYLDKESEKNALTRYYKLWTRSVGPYAQADGSIHMPDLETFQRRLGDTQRNALEKAGHR